MSESVYELVEKSCQTLRLDLSSLEFLPGWLRSITSQKAS